MGHSACVPFLACPLRCRKILCGLSGFQIAGWCFQAKASYSLREKLIKIGAKVVSHGRHVTFQTAEVAVSRQMFAEILSPIARLRALPAPA